MVKRLLLVISAFVGITFLYAVDEKDVLRERFLPHLRDVGVRKGLIVSSFPDAKNSSK